MDCRLEQMCEKELMAEDVNPDFRLWLTSYPSPIFPIAITESGMKITNEAPAGLRAGLERIYKADPVNDPRFFEGCKKESEFKAMIFSLAFFHCVIVGRKAYGPVGARQSEYKNIDNLQHQWHGDVHGFSGAVHYQDLEGLRTAHVYRVCIYINVCSKCRMEYPIYVQ